MFVTFKLRHTVNMPAIQAFDIHRIARILWISAQETRFDYDLDGKTREFTVAESFEAVTDTVNAAYERLARTSRPRPAYTRQQTAVPERAPN